MLQNFLELLDQKLQRYPEWLRQELREELIKEFDKSQFDPKN